MCANIRFIGHISTLIDSYYMGGFLKIRNTEIALLCRRNLENGTYSGASDGGVWIPYPARKSIFFPHPAVAFWSYPAS